MKCKVINSHVSIIENTINDWLKTGKYEIIEIKQTQHGFDVTITIFYLDENEVRSKKLKELNKKSNNNQ